MDDNLNINQLILQTIDEYSTDKDIKKLITKSLRYELDIWNRHLRTSEIEDEYKRIVDNVFKEL